ncbi:glycine-rich domain-containing protein [Zooshikella ganghwensis]|uniref:Uncharacterized protein n=1 Tax=Zooshikella ganghwensis TaxID=202772 RepID=A0A4P9VUX8_9GAMM|nr:hypothetical protein [Zooshikella ganghwensis]RDH46244.1 hypothetical protein B9G39_23905 [Zooshikella ganghwensis]
MEIFAIGVIVIAVIFFVINHKVKKVQQLNYIERYRFQNALKMKVSKKYPQLDREQLKLVFEGLRDYFWMCHKANSQMVAMPSQVVDDAWHEFILFTRAYSQFCKMAIGQFLHHTPTEAMKSSTDATEGIKRAWRLACAREEINPKYPAQLPLIFAIDTMLDIPNGFRYVLDCKENKFGDGYCASHIGCSSGCAGSSGASSCSSDSGGSNCGSSCGGGCGGGD